MQNDPASTEDWAQLATEAHFHVAALAKVIGLSERTLRRRFVGQSHINPHAWLDELRMQEVSVSGERPSSAAATLGDSGALSHS